MGAIAKCEQQSTALGATDAQRAFVQKLNPYLGQVAAVVPRHMLADHYLSLLLRAATEQPKILQCTPESVVIALVDVIRWRLEIGRTVHLVPYGDKLQTIIDYKGYIQLMVNSGHVRDVSAEVVYETDAFEWSLIDQRVTRHERLNAGTPDQIVGAYAVAKLPHGERKFTYLTREQIEARRACSRQPNGEKWSKKNYASACKTSAIREMQKYMPQEAARHIPWEDEAAPTYLFGQARTAGTDEHGPYGAEAMGGAPSRVERAESVTARVEPQPAIDHETPDEPYITSDGEAVDEFDGTCPKCGSAMWSNVAENDGRASRGEKLRPDHKCRNATCGHLIWRGR